ncbi:hypothetical protein PanWU01x14_370140 [Parasponia andersonii]|uniref:Uncharacterized protein n=1 Tax=Parasponia andersonii TaxID=3476 RepID=A0A2P5A4D4_PARAD|nr:hypothetical protein PanWU01x14_370140 [Parasponia andersonii]
MEMNFDEQPLRIDWRRRDETPLARGAENEGRTTLQWPENLIEYKIFVGPLRFHPTSKRGRTSGVGFIFKSSSTRAIGRDRQRWQCGGARTETAFFSFFSLFKDFL